MPAAEKLPATLGSVWTAMPLLADVGFNAISFFFVDLRSLSLKKWLVTPKGKLNLQSVAFIVWAFLLCFLIVAVLLAMKFMTMRIIMLSIAMYPLIFVVLFFVFRLPQLKNDASKDTFFKRFQVGAHRGSHHDFYPENSLDAYIATKNEGAQLIEMDIQMTKDGVPVISHDPTTLASTGVDQLISAMTLNEFKQLRHKLNNASLLTFEEAANWCVEHDMLMMWDVKHGSAPVLDAFVKMIEEKDLYSKVIVSSFNPIDVYRIKVRNSRILTGYTWRSWELSTVDFDAVEHRFSGILHVLAAAIDCIITAGVKSFVLPWFLGTDMLLFHCNDISRSLALEARRNDMHLVAWTCNNDDEMDFFHGFLGVPFLTDDVRQVRWLREVAVGSK